MQQLTEHDYINAANALGVPIAAIKAVTEVESRGGGFVGDRPKVLFEAHWFHKLTKGKYHATHPHLSQPTWALGKQYYKLNQLARLDEALALDRNAAIQSASYGLFQIMGFNFKACGFTSVEAFYSAMCESEGAQLLAFVAFLKSNGLDRHLKAKNWAAFAKGYNGPGYAQNRYDTKLAQVYKKFGGQ
jgi:hypothetical protein